MSDYIILHNLHYSFQYFNPIVLPANPIFQFRNMSPALFPLRVISFFDT